MTVIKLPNSTKSGEQEITHNLFLVMNYPKHFPTNLMRNWFAVIIKVFSF